MSVLVFEVNLYHNHPQKYGMRFIYNDLIDGWTELLEKISYDGIAVVIVVGLDTQSLSISINKLSPIYFQSQETSCPQYVIFKVFLVYVNNHSFAYVIKVACLAYNVVLPSLSNSILLEVTQSWWRHQLKTFSVLLVLCEGIHQSPVDSPHKGQWGGALMLFLICVWTNCWANKRDAGDLRRHCAHYDATVIGSIIFVQIFVWSKCC